MPVIKCPHCSKWVIVREETSCPECGGAVSVPTPERQPPTAEGKRSDEDPETEVEAEALPPEVEQFRDLLNLATPSPWVVVVVVAANIGLFLLMVLDDPRSLSGPTVEQALQFGALHGPNVAAGESWRLLSSNYVHLGIMHLGFNMWCLWGMGRLGEQLFGSLAFVALYLLSGVGGAMTSLWVHPEVVSAGASGAVFGVFGSVIGVMVRRPGMMPPAVLRPLATGTAVFVLFNLVFGFLVPGIDNAAHLGGLGTGFLSGLVLSRSLPLPARCNPISRLVGTGLLALVVGAAAHFSIRQAEPAPPLSPSPADTAEEVKNHYNLYFTGVEPLLGSTRRYSSQVDREEARFNAAPGIPSVHREVLDRLEDLAEQLEENRKIFVEIPVDHSELEPLAESLARHFREKALHAATMAEAVRTRSLERRRAAQAHAEEAAAAWKKFMAARESLMKKHNLRFEPGFP